MAGNAYTGIFPTLVAAFDEAQAVLHAPNTLLQSCYQDFRADQVAALYDTINLNVPSSSYSVTDVGAGTVTIQDVAATSKSVQLNTHPAAVFKLPDYDTMRGYGVSQLRAMFVDEAIEKITSFANAQLAALITAGNFSQVVAGASDNKITTAEAAAMWGTLAKAKVPVKDSANFFLTMHSDVMAQMLPDTTWTGGNNVSPLFAEMARRDASLGTVYGAQPVYDLDMPVAAGVYTSLMFHRRAFACAARAMELPTAGGIAATQVVYKGLPLRITIDWNQLHLAYVMAIDCLFGVTVFRADHACRHTST